MTRSVVERYLGAQWPYDPDALASLRHRDWVMDWPQSGERIRGHENDRSINEGYPGYPRHVILGATGSDEKWALSPSSLPVRISGGSNVWFAELWLEYPNGERFFNVGVLELRDDKIWRDTWYWAPELAPPSWRSEWVEPMERRFEPAVISVVGTEADERVNREVAERFLAREEAGDISGAMREEWSDDAIEYIPQTAEMIRGLDRAVAVIEAAPVLPAVQRRRLIPNGELVALELDLDYGGERWLAFEIARFDNGKIVQATEYFGRPFEPAEWRSQWVELI